MARHVITAEEAARGRANRPSRLLPHLRALAAEGITGAEAARRCGVNRTAVYKLARKHGIVLAKITGAERSRVASAAARMIRARHRLTDEERRRGGLTTALASTAYRGPALWQIALAERQGRAA